MINRRPLQRSYLMKSLANNHPYLMDIVPENFKPKIGIEIAARFTSKQVSSALCAPNNTSAAHG